MNHFEKETRGYINDLYEEIKDKEFDTNYEMCEFIVDYQVPARKGSIFLGLIADDIRTHQFKVPGVREFVLRNRVLDDVPLIHALCNGYGKLIHGVLYRVGNVWK